MRIVNIFLLIFTNLLLLALCKETFVLTTEILSSSQVHNLV